MTTKLHENLWLPKITEDLVDLYGDSQLMRYGAGQWEWTGLAADFACTLNQTRTACETGAEQ